MNLMSTIYLTLIIGIFLIFLIQNKNILKKFALILSITVLFQSAGLLFYFNKELFFFQEIICYKYSSKFLNFSYSFGLDGLSILFFFLSAFLIFLCILFVWNDPFFKNYVINLFIMELFLLIIFSILDLFLFYFFFEAILIPMYLIMGLWGSRERKIRAAQLLFFYTLCSSVLMLIGIIYIYTTVGTLNLIYLSNWNFNLNEQYFLWLCFFFSFASKVPMYPFHIWLPEAHVEAPTVGSVLLAGILLKLGVYGFLRFSIILFPNASSFFLPIIQLLCVISIIHSSLNSIRQTDLKRIIAYSSIAHMNLVILGIFNFNTLGIEGAILQSISHGFVSGGLFFLIGMLYERYHTRYLYYYRGFVHTMPLFISFFLLFTFANIAVPGTSSFVGEFLLLISLFQTNTIICIISSLGVIFAGAYSLWLYNRMSFGNIQINNIHLYQDINSREFIILISLLIFIIILGIYPSVFLDFLHSNTNFIVNHIYKN